MPPELHGPERRVPVDGDPTRSVAPRNVMTTPNTRRTGHGVDWWWRGARGIQCAIRAGDATAERRDFHKFVRGRAAVANGGLGWPGDGSPHRGATREIRAVMSQGGSTLTSCCPRWGTHDLHPVGRRAWHRARPGDDLTMEGYEVEVACDGITAARLRAAYSTRFCSTMPGRMGWRLAVS